MSANEPGPTTDDPAALFSSYLDYYREKVIEKLTALADEEQRNSRVPTGWAPLDLAFHLACMERRWLLWGFLGAPVEQPWEDSGGDPDGHWQVPDGMSLEAVVGRLRDIGGVTRAVLAETPLDTVAATGGRFDAEPPPLAWICFHVLQEYARHVGHLDVGVELAGGPLGE